MNLLTFLPTQQTSQPDSPPSTTSSEPPSARTPPVHQEPERPSEPGSIPATASLPAVGTWFRLPEEPGQVFRVTKHFPNHLEAYGGDKDPNGRRGFRALALDRRFLAVPKPAAYR